MAQDMAQDGGRDNSGEAFGAESTDEATQLKKRARRRLIGAAALALLAAVVLPMVMDHQPAPPMRDIQVRIPSPDEGVTQRVAARPLAAPPEALKEKAPAPQEAPAAQPRDEPPKAGARAAAVPEAKTETQSEAKAGNAPETIAAAKPEARAELPPKTQDKPSDENASGRNAGEAWEVQLGAYQEPGRVKLLLGKLKELGLPTYTEKVETPNGQRTRVRAGPFPSQEAAEKARGRIKIIGIDAPVAKKP